MEVAVREEIIARPLKPRPSSARCWQGWPSGSRRLPNWGRKIPQCRRRSKSWRRRMPNSGRGPRSWSGKAKGGRRRARPCRRAGSIPTPGRSCQNENPGRNAACNPGAGRRCGAKLSESRKADILLFLPTAGADAQIPAHLQLQATGLGTLPGLAPSWRSTVNGLVQHGRFRRWQKVMPAICVRLMPVRSAAYSAWFCPWLSQSSPRGTAPGVRND